jgi:hypothetical protein
MNVEERRAERARWELYRQPASKSEGMFNQKGNALGLKPLLR